MLSIKQIVCHHILLESTVDSPMSCTGFSRSTVVSRMMQQILCVFCLVLLVPTAHAGGLHLAAGVGYLNTEQNGSSNDHGNFAGTVTVGVELMGLILGTVYAEFERSELFDEGEWDGQDYGYSSDGVFLALRTLGPLYAVGRVGYVKAEFDPELRSSVGKRDEAISLGVGYSVGIRNELLYTHIEHEGGGETDVISFVIGF